MERDLPAMAPAPDFWQCADIAALAEQQVVYPIDDFDALLGGWPDDESIDDFVATVREAQRHNLARVISETSP